MACRTRTADIYWYWGCTQTGAFLTSATQMGTLGQQPPLSLSSKTSLGLFWTTKSRAFHFVLVPASELAIRIPCPFPVAPAPRAVNSTSTVPVWLRPESRE